VEVLRRGRAFGVRVDRRERRRVRARRRTSTSS
jgi:hypothetical protein